MTQHPTTIMIISHKPYHPLPIIAASIHPSIHPSILHPLCNKDLVHGLRHNLRYALLAELDEGIALAEGFAKAKFQGGHL